ncbi:hypothetical protein PhCBS80983_g01142 [Powellomyces hirtus]|uniref:Uncharacterized protein n=1 Tax=Powellomyces hirtus TaxID=109895 RepID=A0A507EC54_9FUNG|nr:hypothetical protein PhCBS80983_g01142 [Powellomyces hirtus]
MARAWDIAAVSAWLRSCGFENELSKTFHDNDINGVILLDDITEKDLKDELGVHSLGKRRRIMALIQELREPTVEPKQEATPSSRYESAVSLSVTPPVKSEGLPLKRKRPPDLDHHVDVASMFTHRSFGKRAGNAKEDDTEFSRVERRARSHRDRLTQKMMKRMLRKSNIIYAADDDTGHLQKNHLIALWRPPIRAKNAPVRAFKRTTQGVEDFVDNNGAFDFPADDVEEAAQEAILHHSKTPVLIANHGFVKKVAGGYSCSRRKHDLDEDSDDVLPLYGESDDAEYESDSEWDQEEAEKNGFCLETSGQQVAPAPIGSGHRGNRDQEIPDEQPGVHDLKDFSRSGKRWGGKRKRSSRYTGRRGRKSQNALPVVVGTTNRYLSDDAIRSIIDAEIARMKERWREKELVKLERNAYRLFQKKKGLLDDMKAELEDLHTRRVSRQIDSYLAQQNCNEKDVRSKCANLEPTVHLMCELKWYIELVQGPCPEKPPPKERKKQSHAGKPRVGSKDEGEESDRWSDFIASEDEYADGYQSMDISSGPEPEAPQQTRVASAPPVDDTDGESFSDELNVSPQDLTPSQSMEQKHGWDFEAPATWRSRTPEVILHSFGPLSSGEAEHPTTNANDSGGSPAKIGIAAKQPTRRESGHADPTPPMLEEAPKPGQAAHDDLAQPDVKPLKAAMELESSRVGNALRKRAEIVSLLSDDEFEGFERQPTNKTTSASVATKGHETIRNLHSIKSALADRRKMEGSAGDGRPMPVSRKSLNGVVRPSSSTAHPAQKSDPDKGSHGSSSTFHPAERSKHLKAIPSLKRRRSRRKELNEYFLQNWSQVPAEKLLDLIEGYRQEPIDGLGPQDAFFGQLVLEFEKFMWETNDFNPRNGLTARQRILHPSERQMNFKDRKNLERFIEWRSTNMSYSDIEEDLDDVHIQKGWSGVKSSARRTKSFKLPDSDDDDTLPGPLKERKRLEPNIRANENRKRQPKKTLRRASPIIIDDEESSESLGTDDEESDGEHDSQKTGDHRRDILKIRPENAKTLKLRDDRKRQEGQIERRKKRQAKEMAATKDIIINLGHDEKEKHILVAPFLAGQLKDHQIQGIQFMWKNIIMVKQPSPDGQAMRHAGCILAHAMGLGKTIQTITFIYTLMDEIRKGNEAIPPHLREGRILIVVPVSVVINWKAEITKWIDAEDISTTLKKIYTLQAGGASDSQRSRRLEIVDMWFKSGGVLIVGYEMMGVLSDMSTSVDVEGEQLMEQLFNGASLLICDEGHLLKNRKAKRTLVLDKVKTPSRIILTGYPLQNNLSEYWCMIDFAVSNFLGDLSEFRNAYENPIKNGLCSDSTAGDIKLMRVRMNVLTALIAPIVQRIDTAPLKHELPAKTEFLINCKLTPLQHEVYKTYLTSLQESVNIVANMHSMIMICGHPGVFKNELDGKRQLDEGKINSMHLIADGLTNPSTSSADNEGVVAYPSASPADNEGEVAGSSTPSPEKEAVENLEAIAADLAILQDVRPTFDQIYAKYPDYMSDNYSSKVKMTKRIVKAAIARGKKVLIFSTGLPTLHHLKSVLEGMDIASYVLEGKTSATERQRRIDQYSTDNVSVFLISTKAGGMGINLQAATRVIIFDIGWNPSDAEQAIARAYRYGQKESVIVYRLQTCGTFESTLFKTNVHKVKLSKQVVDKVNTARSFTKAEMKEYLRIPAADSAWDLSPEQEQELLRKADPILNAILADAQDDCRHDLVAIRKHDVEEIENEMNEEERMESRMMLEQEKMRRKSGLGRGGVVGAGLGGDGTAITTMTTAAPITAPVNALPNAPINAQMNPPTFPSLSIPTTVPINASLNAPLNAPINASTSASTNAPTGTNAPAPPPPAPRDGAAVLRALGIRFGTMPTPQQPIDRPAGFSLDEWTEYVNRLHNPKLSAVRADLQR